MVTIERAVPVRRKLRATYDRRRAPLDGHGTPSHLHRVRRRGIRVALVRSVRTMPRRRLTVPTALLLTQLGLADCTANERSDAGGDGTTADTHASDVAALDVAS